MDDAEGGALAVNNDLRAATSPQQAADGLVRRNGGIFLLLLINRSNHNIYFTDLITKS